VKTLPIMRGVRDYSSFPLLVNISAGYPGTKEWVQQVQARFHLKMVAGVTAVSAPEYYPYLQSGQLHGLLGGMAGAAEYEKARNETGTATRGMTAQSMAHVFVAIMILLGNVVQWTGRRARHEFPSDGDLGSGRSAYLFIFSFLYKDNLFYKFAGTCSWVSAPATSSSCASGRSSSRTSGTR
jgi:hypothetical protein